MLATMTTTAMITVGMAARAYIFPGPGTVGTGPLPPTTIRIIIRTRTIIRWLRLTVLRSVLSHIFPVQEASPQRVACISVTTHRVIIRPSRAVITLGRLFPCCRSKTRPTFRKCSKRRPIFRKWQLRRLLTLRVNGGYPARAGDPFTASIAYIHSIREIEPCRRAILASRL